jgi:hypothetical protein
MYKSQNQFNTINIGNHWGQYDDIEANYPDIISKPFPFSTSKPVTKLLIRPATKSITKSIEIPAATRQFKNYDYDIEANLPEVKKEYNNFSEIKTNKKESDLKSNINMTNCITVSIITYIIFFIA